MKNNILITGGAGYIGSFLTADLLRLGKSVKVLDRLYFGPEPLEKHFNDPNFSLLKDDIRYFDKKNLEGVDIVVHLAALSNDPLCEIDPSATRSINYKGTVRMAKLAKEMGVKRFIFASSCSVYGAGNNLLLNEESPVNPVSLYAKAKLMAENELLKMADNDFTVTILRNATVYGLSERMRFDLVVNIMTLHAFKNKKIYISGGGEQWRPNVHVQDVSSAFIKVIDAPAEKIQKQIFNVGSDEQNYKVIQIANMVKKVMPDTSIENIPTDPEKRNYNVSFRKIREVLGFSVRKNVNDGITDIRSALENGVVTDSLKTKTLDYYKYLLEANNIMQDVTRKGKIF